MVRQSTSILDMGTGGGELLSSLAPFPEHIVATEGWQPNLTPARKRLEPLGVRVLEVDESADLPFADDVFDTILNRHTAFRASEVARVLKPGGTFLTQQVEGGNLSDLMAEFGAKPQFEDWALDVAKGQLVVAGLKVEESREWTGQVEFKDVGAIVYFLTAVPWVVKGFSVDNNLQQLEKLQEKIERGRKLIFTEVRFMLRTGKS